MNHHKSIVKVVNRLDTRNNDGKSRQYNQSGRRWWLKLEYAFFFDKRVCALRRKLGDRALIYYEKIMLRSLENSSSMKFEGLEETFEEEIAVDIMEDNGESVQLIRQIMDFLVQYGLMMEQPDGSYFFPQAADMSGDESSSAARMRNKRARDKETEPSQCDVTASQETEQGDVQSSQCDPTQLHSDDKPSQSNALSHCNAEPSQCDEKTSQRYHINNKNNNRSRSKSRIDLDLELELKQESETSKPDSDSVSAERAASSAAEAAAPPAGELFSVDQLREIITKHEIDINGGGVMAFHAEMQKESWVLYQKPVTKTGIVKALRGWAKYHEKYHLSDDAKMERKICNIIKDCIGKEGLDAFMGCDDGCESEMLKDCPVEAFTDEMLEYMTEEWGIPFDSGGDET